MQLVGAPTRREQSERRGTAALLQLVWCGRRGSAHPDGALVLERSGAARHGRALDRQAAAPLWPLRTERRDHGLPAGGEVLLRSLAPSGLRRRVREEVEGGAVVS